MAGGTPVVPGHVQGGNMIRYRIELTHGSKYLYEESGVSTLAVPALLAEVSGRLLASVAAEWQLWTERGGSDLFGQNEHGMGLRPAALTISITEAR